MKIKYLGHASFLLKFKRTKVVTDPFDPQMVGIKFPRVEADIVTLSHHHQDHDRADLVKGSPLVIDLPGEYEKEGVRITGVLTYHDKSKGQKRGENVVFKMEGEDGIKVLHCGDLGHVLTDDQIEKIGEVDVLLIPVGGFYTIGPEEAMEVINKIEPAIVVPMHYNHSALNQAVFSQIKPVDEFLKVAGVSEIERVDELEISKNDIVEKEKEIVLLNIT